MGGVPSFAPSDIAQSGLGCRIGIALKTLVITIV